MIPTVDLLTGYAFNGYTGISFFCRIPTWGLVHHMLHSSRPVLAHPITIDHRTQVITLLCTKETAAFWDLHDVSPVKLLTIELPLPLY